MSRSWVEHAAGLVLIVATAASSSLPHAGQSGAPPEALASPHRRSPIVRVVEQVSASVVGQSAQDLAEGRAAHRGA